LNGFSDTIYIRKNYVFETLVFSLDIGQWPDIGF